MLAIRRLVTVHKTVLKKRPRCLLTFTSSYPTITTTYSARAWASTETTPPSRSAEFLKSPPSSQSVSTTLESAPSTLASAKKPISSTSAKHTQMDVRRVYRYLGLESFSKQEMNQVFEQIISTVKEKPKETTTHSGTAVPTDNEHESVHVNGKDEPRMTHAHLTAFLLDRIGDFQADQEEGLYETVYPSDEETQQHMILYAQEQASQLLSALEVQHPEHDFVTQEEFSSRLTNMATSIDLQRTLPITVSMLLVGSSVGIITPVMPFVVQELGLTSGQFGMVVSAFALAKIGANVPSAIFVERHGRKPYLVYSLSVIALGVGGIGFASSFPHLIVCRLLTGIGVAALSSAATLTMADISTPRNRASTMAPIMSAFAAGTALGPALGGVSADFFGIHPTFYLVGASYFLLTGVNHVLLTETKPAQDVFPWQRKRTAADSSTFVKTKRKTPTITQAFQEAVGQWAPLLSDTRVRNVVIMNGFYWIALAGAQMTLLPLMLTDPSGLAMSATSVGQVYMGMSAVQVFGNPVLAKFVDKMGKGPAIVGGCTLISTSMALLPLCNDVYQLAGVLGVWATGSTMLSTAPVAYISDKVDEEKRAQAIALLRTAGDVGFLLGASGMGALADFTGDMDVAMQTSAGVLLTATGWFAARQFLSSKIPSS